MKAKIIRLPETASTNSYAIEMLSKDRPENGTVIITDFQTHGKGTDTNTWESEKGRNLTLSLILYPAFNAGQQFILNKAISLAICNFLQSELPEKHVKVKWPNDIYIEDKKVCGILIQNSVIGNRLDYVVAGIGLNVNQVSFTGNAPNPVSMKMATGTEYDLNEFLDRFLNSIFEKYALVKTETSEIIENEYDKQLYRRMEWHDYLINDIRINARITGTSAYGQLLLETKTNQKLTCDLKEVKFLI